MIRVHFQDETGAELIGSSVVCESPMAGDEVQSSEKRYVVLKRIISVQTGVLTCVVREIAPVFNVDVAKFIEEWEKLSQKEQSGPLQVVGTGSWYPSEAFVIDRLGRERAKLIDYVANTHGCSRNDVEQALQEPIFRLPPRGS